MRLYFVVDEMAYVLNILADNSFNFLWRLIFVIYPCEKNNVAY